MKVSILSTSSAGGAGIAALRLHSAFLENSVDSSIYVRYLQNTKYSNSVRVLEDRTVYSREQREKMSIIDEMEKHFFSTNRTAISQTVFDIGLSSCFDVSQIPELFNSDIINFHWTSSFVGNHAVEELASNGKAIVFTMHDEWLYTGGCHYTAGCQKFNEECDSSCPQLISDPFDLVLQSFQEKSRALSMANPLIITPSKWLMKRASNSKLLAKFNCLAIPNPFPTSELVYRDHIARKQFSSIYNILGQKGSNEFYVLLAAASLLDTRKGFDYSIDILERLYAILSPFQRQRVKILLLGLPSKRLVESIPFSVIELGSFDNIGDLSCIYSYVDVFLNTTKEDNYPNVVIESLLCGTPVVAFDIGGIKEQVNSDCGCILPFADNNSVAFTLQSMICGTKQFAPRDIIRSSVEDSHSPNTVAGLYQQAFQNHLSLNKRQESNHLFFGNNYRRNVHVPIVMDLGTNIDMTLKLKPVVELLERKTSHSIQAIAPLSQYLVPNREYGPTSNELNLLCTFGWSNIEASGRWSCERRAYLILVVNPNDLMCDDDKSGFLHLFLTLKGYCYGSKQRIFVRNSEQKIPIDITEQMRSATVKLSVDLMQSPYIPLCFEFPQARREKGGYRMLGLHLNSFTITK